MKNSIMKMFLMSMVFVAAWACTNLDEHPVGLLSPNSFFKTEADAQTAVNGCYDGFCSEPLYGQKMTLTIQLLGDQCDICNPGTDPSRVALNNFTADAGNTTLAAIWPEIWVVVGACNSAIDGIPSCAMDQDKKNQLISEAKMVRAWCYFNLVQLWGPVPYIDKFVTDPNAIKSVSRTPVDTIYSKIIADCLEGIKYLPNTYSGGVRSRPSKGSAETMLASVYLTRHDYTDAALYAQDVIDNASDYGYDLLPDFKDLWSDDNDNNVEQVWTVDFKHQNEWYNEIGEMTSPRNTDMQGWSVYCAAPGVYESFDDQDYRKKVSFLTAAPVNGVLTPDSLWTPAFNANRPFIAKWCNYPGTAGGLMNSASVFDLYRFAEVYLIAAEAINESSGGPTDVALADINKVRARARNYGGTPTNFPADLLPGMSQADFRTAVRNERWLELAFEWKRWYDIKRWDIGVDVFTGPNSFEPHANFTKDFYLLPIPQTELDMNPNLKPQNPGY